MNIDEIRDRYIANYKEFQYPETDKSITRVYSELAWDDDALEVCRDEYKQESFWEWNENDEEMMFDLMKKIEFEKEYNDNENEFEVVDNFINTEFEKEISAGGSTYELYDDWVNHFSPSDNGSIFTCGVKTYKLATAKSVSIDYYLDQDGKLYKTSNDLNNIASDIKLDDGFRYELYIDDATEDLIFECGVGNSMVYKQLRYVDDDLGDFIEYNELSDEMENYIYDEIAVPLGYSLKDEMFDGYDFDLGKIQHDYNNHLVRDYLISPDTYNSIYQKVQEDKVKNEEYYDVVDIDVVNNDAVTYYLCIDKDNSIHQNVVSKLENGITPEQYEKKYNQQMDEYKQGVEEPKAKKKVKM